VPNNLTQRQKEIITSEQLGKHRNISLDLSLHADLILLMQDNPDRFSSFSALVREACYCLLHYGLNWRSGNNSEIIKVIREEIGRLEVVREKEDASGTNDKFDDTEGFFTE
jgi:hypothetical protein